MRINLKNKNLRKTLKKMRISNQISQLYLSKITGITQGTISKMESGEISISFESILKIFQAAGYDPIIWIDRTTSKIFMEI